MKVMKTIVVILLLLLFMIGCENINPQTEESNTLSDDSNSVETSYEQSETSEDESSGNENSISYQEGVYEDRFWTEEGLELIQDVGGAPNANNPVITNKEIAVEIALIVFNSYSIVDDWDTENFVVSKVFFDTIDDVWIVVFSEPVEYASGTVTLVLKKENAQIIAFWAEAG